MSDDAYEYWHAALAGEKPQVTNQPMPGFYRMKNGQAVAIWSDEDAEEPSRVTVMVGTDRIVKPDDHEDIWLRCCTRPVEQHDYEAVIDGGVWPDMDVSVAATLGDNIGDADDPETLKDLLEGLELASETYHVITDHAMAARAQSIRARALELKKRADDRRAELKAPHLAAGQAVDRQWQPLVKAGQTIADSLRKALSAWETKQFEERRKAEVKIPEPAGIKPGYGRAASTRIMQRVTHITDIAKLCEWMAFADSEVLKAWLIDRAQHHVNAGLMPPGVAVEQHVEVR
jgi:hypothetical protein